MPLNLIASVVNHKNKLAIGADNSLLIRLSRDMMFFREITSNSLSIHSKINRNVVLMGIHTWLSIPPTNRPLKDRLCLVLTSSKELHNLTPYPGNLKFIFEKDYNKIYNKDLYYITFEQFLDFYKKTNANVFVIGGSVVYNKFLNDPNLQPDNLYITEIKNYKIDQSKPPNRFMDKFGENYKLIGVSEKFCNQNLNIEFRFLKYKNIPGYHTDEYKYIELCKEILTKGNHRPDRTGVGTISLFGKQLRFDISNSVPVLTTKRVAWKHCLEELLWFLKGNTDAKILQEKGVKIWNGNSSREFLDSRGLNDYPDGVLGPLYGFQWRFFGADYEKNFADISKLSEEDLSKLHENGIDQIEYVINELKTNPYSRRILVSAWNPKSNPKMALEPCHILFQFYVGTDKSNQKHLSCHFFMRSNDIGCGTSFNLLSYAALTYIIALKCDMRPKELIYTCSDAHIYSNHILPIEKQLTRDKHPFPKLILNPEIKNKQISELDISDFELVGYFPEPAIPMTMAI